MSSEAAAKKDTQKLQRAIIDGLEDVKAQDIQVFNTEHLSPLFERVIVASGTSNRQTKALAASVRDAVREAGFAKPRTEGEENGEWIIVDCGAAVAHIMQPAIRQYYHLEEIWGEKPVRIKFGAPKPAEGAAKATKSVTDSAGTLRGSLAAKSVARQARGTVQPAAKRAAPVKTAVKKTAAKTAAKAAPKTAAKAAPKKTAAKTSAVKTPAAKKAVPLKKTAARKSATRRSA